MLRHCAKLVLILLIEAVLSSQEAASSSTPPIHTSNSEIGDIDISNFPPTSHVKIGDGVFTLPLIPHHVIQERRRRELGISKEELQKSYENSVRRNLADDSFGNTINESSRHTVRRLNDISLDPLYQGFGTHYVDLWVGTPPQRQTVIVDTGSGVTAFPCKACTVNCGEGYHTDKNFIEDSSTTFHKLQCGECSKSAFCRDRQTSSEHCSVSVSYQEGSSWYAYEGRDILYAGGLHDQAVTLSKNRTNDTDGEDPSNAAAYQFPLIFGCQNRITGLFVTQLADGIMGMSNSAGSFWNQMHNAGVTSQKKFSLCFRRGDDASTEGTHAGAMTMGGTEPRLHTTPMLYVRANKSKSTMHGVKLRNLYLMRGGYYHLLNATEQTTIRVDVSQSMLQGSSVIVDSGTTDTYMTRAITTEFNKAWRQIFGTDYTTDGFDLTDEDIDRLPTIVIQIQGKMSDNVRFDPQNPDSVPGLSGKLDPEHPDDVLLLMTPSHYIEYDTKKNKYMARFYTTESSSSVIGANAMSGHDFLFDTDENSRIGIAKSECSYVDFLSHTKDSDLDISTSEPQVSGPGISTSEPTPFPSLGKTSQAPTSGLKDVSVNENERPGNDSQRDIKPMIMLGGFITSVILLLFIVYRQRRLHLYEQTTTTDNLDVESELPEIS